MGETERHSRELLAFIDVEVGLGDNKVHDFGAYKEPDLSLHTGVK